MKRARLLDEKRRKGNQWHPIYRKSSFLHWLLRGLAGLKFTKGKKETTVACPISRRKHTWEWLSMSINSIFYRTYAHSQQPISLRSSRTEEFMDEIVRRQNEEILTRCPALYGSGPQFELLSWGSWAPRPGRWNISPRTEATHTTSQTTSTERHLGQKRKQNHLTHSSKKSIQSKL